MTAPPDVPACRDADNPGLFESTEVHMHELARVFCKKCPVVDWCLEERERVNADAIAGSVTVGTWGGLLWLSNGHSVRIEHGTDRGYNQHRYRGDKPCKPCRAAHLAYDRAKQAARREVANA